MTQKQQKLAGHTPRRRLHGNDRRGFGHVHTGGARDLAGAWRRRGTWHALVEEGTDARHRHEFTIKGAAGAARVPRQRGTARGPRSKAPQGRGRRHRAIDLQPMKSAPMNRSPAIPFTFTASSTFNW